MLSETILLLQITNKNSLRSFFPRVLLGYYTYASCCQKCRNCLNVGVKEAA